MNHIKMAAKNRRRRKKEILTPALFRRRQAMAGQAFKERGKIFAPFALFRGYPFVGYPWAS
jgi:hypothetical protein